MRQGREYNSTDEDLSEGATTMGEAVHACECEACQGDQAHPDRARHAEMNLLLSRMDEQQRRWYAAAEANALGHGGQRRMALVTGLDEKTIRRGQRELADGLLNRPVERVRLPGGGRHRVEKKIPA